MLEVTEYNPGDAHVLMLHGELDLATAPALTARMASRRSARTVIDLSKLAFCDSTGLRALLGEARECEICGGSVTVVVPRDGIVRKLFDICCVDQMMAVTSR